MNTSDLKQWLWNMQQPNLQPGVSSITKHQKKPEKIRWFSFTLIKIRMPFLLFSPSNLIFILGSTHQFSKQTNYINETNQGFKQ